MTVFFFPQRRCLAGADRVVPPQCQQLLNKKDERDEKIKILDSIHQVFEHHSFNIAGQCS